jgi:type I restriction enzyme M protein
MAKITLQELESFLWKSADILRGKIDSSDYKKYIFGLLFYKRINDVWREEHEEFLKEYKGTEAEEENFHRFQLPDDCKWEKLQNTSSGIGMKLNKIFDRLTNANSPKLDKIFDDLDFASTDKFPNDILQKLINHFSQYNFGNTYINSDLLGDAYEYLIKQFATDAGKKGGEFYTPREVERVIIQILKPHEKDHIYDPTCGSGGFLLEAYHYVREKFGERATKKLYLYGQEMNIGTFAIAKINMFLHGLDGADIRREDTLKEPLFKDELGNLKTFDIVVANPPYSIKEWPFEAFEGDKYGRRDGFDMPPRKNADYAFILHMIASLNQNGKAGIVLPHGVLSRSGAEARIREQLIKKDLIEAIIALPAKLFYGTGIPACILILNKNKPEKHQNKILFIDGEKDYLEGKNQNSLKVKDVEKIVKAFENYKGIPKYSRIVASEEVKENDFNLKISLYVENGADEEIVDINIVYNELKNLGIKREINSKEVNKLVEKILAEGTKQEKLKETKIGMIPNNWEVKTVEELFNFNNGYAFYSDGYSENGKRVIDLLNITTDGRLNLTNKDKFIPIDLYNKHPKQHLCKDDLIIIMTDITPDKKLLGRCAIIDKSDEYALNQRVGCLRKKSEDIDINFYKYLFNSEKIHRKFVSHALGTAQFYINTPTIKNLKVPVPPLEEQKRIVNILSSVDEKIDIYKKIKSQLELLKKGLMQDLLK